MMHQILFQKGVEEIQKLAKFLDVSASNDFCRSVAAKCNFENMVKDKGQEDSAMFKKGFGFYRKGRFQYKTGF